MKKFNLSINGLLFLCLILSILFSSCAQDEDIVETQIIPELTGEETNMVMPIGFEEMTEDESNAFFSNLNEETARALETSYDVYLYLVYINKLEVVTNEMSEGMFYASVDLSKYINQRELEGMNNFNPELVEDYRSTTYIRCYSQSYWCNWGPMRLYKRCSGTYYGWCYQCPYN